MALRCATSSQSLTRTANLPSSTAFTALGYFAQRGTQSASGANLFAVSASAFSNYMYIGYNSTNISLVTPTGNTTIIAAPATDTWFFFAITNAGTGATDLKGYYAALGDTALTTASRTGRSFTVATIGCSDNSAGLWTNGDFANPRVYDAVLTQAELENERQSLLPTRTANINLWTPTIDSTLANCVLDMSGNGRNWTSAGTPTVQSNPPVSWGSPVQTLPYYVPAGGVSAPVLYHQLKQQGFG